jgi:transcriptional regulator with XRE-family HTH domain
MGKDVALPGTGSPAQVAMSTSDRPPRNAWPGRLIDFGIILPRSHHVNVYSAPHAVEPMNKKIPNPIDRHVGARVRMRRMMMSMSQEKLGDQLNLTFQQVQKYEKGTNRIGASRLQQISRILAVPVSFFFEGAPGQSDETGGFAEGPATGYVSDFLATSEGLALTRAFLRVRDPKVRRRIVDLVESLAEPNGTDPEPPPLS